MMSFFVLNTIMSYNYKQGIYEIDNWDKYVGTQQPRYLSSLEYKFFKWADHCKHIIEWGSESVVVPYYNPVKQRQARYLVDIYIKYNDRDGVLRKELVEIKPSNQSKPPTKGGKSQVNYTKAVLTWEVNRAKWEAASQYAIQHGMVFRVITEKHINGRNF